MDAERLIRRNRTYSTPDPPPRKVLHVANAPEPANRPMPPPPVIPEEVSKLFARELEISDMHYI
jgi:hypothetical protein